MHTVLLFQTTHQTQSYGSCFPRSFQKLNQVTGNGKKTGLSLKNIFYTCCERLMVHLQQREVNIDEAKFTLQGLRQHYHPPLPAFHVVTILFT